MYSTKMRIGTKNKDTKGNALGNSRVKDTGTVRRWIRALAISMAPGQRSANALLRDRFLHRHWSQYNKEAEQDEGPRFAIDGC